MKKSKRKDRYEIVTMQFYQPVKITSYSIDPEGDIRMFSDGVQVIPQKVHYEKGIERDKKNKRTIVAEIGRTNINIYNDFRDYDFFVALDTNTREGLSASFGMIYRIIRKAPEDNQFGLMLLSIVKKGFKHPNVANGSPELSALNSMIKYLTEENGIVNFQESRTIIVIDHSLGKIDSFNSRMCPLVEGDNNSFLPPNVKLIYASADKYNDSMINRIIKECDRNADAMLKQ